MKKEVWNYQIWWEAQVRLALRNLRGQELKDRLDHLLVYHGYTCRNNASTDIPHRRASSP